MVSKNKNTILTSLKIVGKNSKRVKICFPQRQNVFVFSLAWTDLFVGLLISLKPYLKQRGVAFHDMFARKVFCNALHSLEVILVAVSIYHLLALSVDRLYLIRHPFKFLKMKNNLRQVYLTVLFCWVLSFLPAAPLWSEWDTRTAMSTNCWTICRFPKDNVSIRFIFNFVGIKSCT